MEKIPCLEKAILRIREEIVRQNELHGEHDHPDADPVLLNRVGITHERIAEELEIPTELRAQINCRHAFEVGEGNWSVILVEELCEAIGAIGNKEKLQTELIQTAAVALQWWMALDKRMPRMSK